MASKHNSENYLLAKEDTIMTFMTCFTKYIGILNNLVNKNLVCRDECCSVINLLSDLVL